MQTALVARVGKLLGGRNPAPLGTDDSARQCHSDCADNTLLQEMVNFTYNAKRAHIINRSEKKMSPGPSAPRRSQRATAFASVVSLCARTCVPLSRSCVTQVAD